MHENSWKYLTTPGDSFLGLKTDRVGMKNWINDIIQRIQVIEDDNEAIRTLFVINQKVGMVIGNQDSYYYPEELYRKLQITVNKLLEVRLSSLNK